MTEDVYILSFCDQAWRVFDVDCEDVNLFDCVDGALNFIKGREYEKSAVMDEVTSE